MNTTYRLSLILGLFATAATQLFAAATAPDSSTAPDPKPYPLGTCVVSGEKLGGDMGDPVTFAYQGREIKLCCNSCRKDFDAAPAKFLAKVDAAAKKVKPYPLKTCIVSGEKLGEMGKPVVFVEKLQEIKLCCKSCKKDFDKDTQQYLSQLKKEAAKAQSTSATPKP